MEMKNNDSIWIVMLLLLFSCELKKEVSDISPYYQGDKLVVHGYLSENDGLVLTVRKSLPPNTPNASDVVDDARAILYLNNNEIYELVRIDSMHYVLPQGVVLSSEKTYRLVVESGMYGMVCSDIQKIPAANASSSIKVDKTRPSFVFISAFDTMPDIAGYYVKIKEYPGSDEYVFSEDEFFSSYSLIEKDNSGMVKKEMYLDSDFTELDSMEVCLYSLSEQTVCFLQSFKDYETTEGDVFYEFVAPVYSNIEGGYGFFGAYGVSKKMFYFE